MNAIHSKKTIERRRLIILDDQFATPEGSKSFLKETGASSEECIFKTCWHEPSQNYALYEVKALFESLNRNELVAENYILLLDVEFGDQGGFGLEALEWLVTNYPALPVIMMTSHVPMNGGTLYYQKLGAFDCIYKRLELGRFWQILNRYISKNASEWVLGTDNRTVGLTNSISGLSRMGNGMIVQASNSIEAKRWCHYALECALRHLNKEGVIREIDLQEVTSEAEIWRKLVGKELQSWDDFECTPEAWLAQETPVIIHNIELLPTDLQILLGREMHGTAKQSVDRHKLPYLIASTLQPLNRMLEQGFYEVLANSLSGKTPVLSPYPGVDVTGITYLIGIHRRINGYFDKKALSEISMSHVRVAMDTVSVSNFQAWWRKICTKLLTTPEVDLPTLFGGGPSDTKMNSRLFTDQLRELNVAEAELLLKAYQQCNGNRTRAMQLLKKGTSPSKKWTTNHFDRWYKTAWKALDEDGVDMLKQRCDASILDELCKLI